jgi:preprotein translocase SecE subunit
MKNFIDDLKKEYSLITRPSMSEVVYISFLVIVFSVFISLSIVGVDFIIGSIINSILFS